MSHGEQNMKVANTMQAPVRASFFHSENNKKQYSYNYKRIGKYDFC